MKLDVIIPIVKVDIPTFRGNLPYILKNLPVKRIILIGAKEVELLVNDLEEVYFINEDNIIPGLTLNKIKEIKKDISGTERRSGWYFQQFIKMAYAQICNDEYYLVWDSDTIPIKKIVFFDRNGKPYLDYREHVKYDECFFRTQKVLMTNKKLNRTTDNSFICEHLLVNVHIMRNLLHDLEIFGTAQKKTFFENIMYSISKDLINLSGFSEFETYASYVMNEYSDTHILRYWKNLRNAGIYIGRNLSKSNVNWLSKSFEVISIEDFNPQWLICKLISWIDPNHKVQFSTIYRIIQPIYNITYNLRFKVRNFVNK